MAIILAATIVAVYLVLFALLYAAQRQLVFPGSLTQGQADAGITPPLGVELLSLTTPHFHERVPALYGAALLPDGEPDPDARHRRTLLFFHGNGGSVDDYRPIFQNLRLLGVNVLMPEYPGYGEATGNASEAGCYDAAETAYCYALSRPDTESGRIVVSGWSLGSGVAIDLAARHPVAGVATFSAYTSMAEMGAYQYPIFPAPLIRLALKHRFLSERKISQVHCPVFISHGEDDRTIPCAMSRRLARAAGGPVTFLAIPGVAHNDFFENGGDQVYPALGRWLKIAEVRTPSRRPAGSPTPSPRVRPSPPTASPSPKAGSQASSPN